MPLRFQGVDPETQGYRILDEEAGEEMLWPPGIPEVENSVAMLQQEEEDRRLAMGPREAMQRGGGGGGSPIPSGTEQSTESRTPGASGLVDEVWERSDDPTFPDTFSGYQAEKAGQEQPAEEPQEGGGEIITAENAPATIGGGDAPVQPGQRTPFEQMGMPTGPSGRPLVRVPGQAGRPAGFVPQSRVSQPGPSDDSISKYVSSLDKQREAAEARADAEREALRAQEATLANQAVQQEAEVTERLLKKRQVERRVQEKQQQVELRRQELRNTPEPHQRLFSTDTPKDTFRSVMAAVMMGIGEFAAQLGGGPNTAKNIIDQMIERDIQEQKDAIALQEEGVEQAENALAEYIDIHGDPRQAEAELRAAQLELAKMDAQQMMIGHQDDAIGAQLQETIAQIDQHQAQLMMDISEREQGKVSFAYDTGQRASAGGYREATLEETTGMLEGMAKYKNALAEATGTSKENQEKVIKYAKDLEAAGIPELQGAGQQLYDTITQAGEKGALGTGGRLTPEFLQGAEGRNVRAALNNFVDAYLRSKTGAAAPPEEKKFYRQILEGSVVSSPEEVLSRVGRALQSSRTQAKNLSKGYGPEVVRTYNQQRAIMPEIIAQQNAPGDWRSQMEAVE